MKLIIKLSLLCSVLFSSIVYAGEKRMVTENIRDTQFWIVTDTKTGCQYLINRENRVTFLQNTCTVNPYTGHRDLPSTTNIPQEK